MSFKSLQQLILLTISLGVVFFYIQPKLLELRSLQDEVVEYREAVNRATEFNQALTSLLNRVDAIPRNDIEALEQFLPIETDVVAVAGDIENIATANNMNIQTISLAETDIEFGNDQFGRNQENFDEFDEESMDEQDDVPLNPNELLAVSRFSVSLTGAYADFKQFLATVEANRYLMNVVAVSISAATEGVEEEIGLLGFEVEIEVYNMRSSL